MLVGYNTNVPIRHHIPCPDRRQRTEKSLYRNAVVPEGFYIGLKEVSYAHLASSPDCKEKAREMMKEQHKAMIKSLLRASIPWR
jgi:hypothetical protein